VGVNTSLKIFTFKFYPCVFMFKFYPLDLGGWNLVLHLRCDKKNKNQILNAKNEMVFCKKLWYTVCIDKKKGTLRKEPGAESAKDGGRNA